MTSLRLRNNGVGDKVETEKEKEKEKEREGSKATYQKK